MGLNQTIKQAQIAQLAASNYAPGSVTAPAIGAGAIGPAALNVSVVGNGLAGGGGSPLSVLAADRSISVTVGGVAVQFDSSVSGSGLTTTAGGSGGVKINLAGSSGLSLSGGQLLVDNTLVALLAGPQTFTGVKTHSANIVMSGSATIKGIPNPANDTDAANKQYVDAVVQGLSAHDSARLATTGALAANTYLQRFRVSVGSVAGLVVGDTVNDTLGNTGTIFQIDALNDEVVITVTAGTWSLTGTFNDVTQAISQPYTNGVSGPGSTLTATGNGALTVDSVVVVLNDRILVKSEVTQANNGIYRVIQVGDGSHPYILERTTDFDETTGTHPNISPGSFVFVSEGTVNSFSGWILTSTFPVVVGTTAITFSQFSGGGGGGVTAGPGLQLIGSQISVLPDPNGGNPTISTSISGTMVVGATSVGDMGAGNTLGVTAAFGSSGKVAWANHVHQRDVYRQQPFTGLTALAGATTNLVLTSSPIQGAADSTTNGNKLIQLYLNGVLLQQGGTDHVSGDYYVVTGTATYLGGLALASTDVFLADFYALT